MPGFSQVDADAWYKRNKHKLDAGPDHVHIRMIEAGVVPKRVLEIGCADGWRLRTLQDFYRCEAFGVDYSKAAIKAGRGSIFNVFKSPAERPYLRHIDSPLLPFKPDSFDVVIYGFCLYVAEPSELWAIADEGDRVLQDGGFIVIHDFLPRLPYSRLFEHNPDLRSRKMNHANLWLCHPSYKMVGRSVYGSDDDRTHVTIIQKDTASAFPLLELENEDHRRDWIGVDREKAR